MTEDQTPVVPEKKQKKKGTVRLPTKLALLDIISAHKYGVPKNYKVVALRHGVSPGSLRAAFMNWNKGLISLGEPESVEEKKIEADIQNAKSHHLLRETESFINDLHEGELARAKHAASEGKRMDAIAALKDVLNLRMTLTRCYESAERRQLAMIDAIRRERERIAQEKMQEANATLVVTKEVEEADEHERMMRALEQSHVELAETSPIPDSSDESDE